MKAASLAWAGTVEKSEQSDVGVGRNRVRVKKSAAVALSVVTFSRTRFGCVEVKFILHFFLPNICPKTKFHLNGIKNPEVRVS